MEPDCLFCKIVEGKEPSTKLFENNSVIAFLDIFPITAGHTLVVPKEHSKNLLEVSENNLGQILKAIQLIGSAQMKAFNAEGFNVLQSNNPVAGQVIFHTHFHVIPRKEGDGLKFAWPSEKTSEDELKETQKKLKEFL